jgi:DNA-directed RNA polymerase specialized sigma24 family protein
VRWSELATRQLLRKLHTPAAIDGDPMAAAITAATRIASPREAVQHVVERALQPYPEVYRTVVRRMDVEGADTSALIEELGCSARSVYRYRAHAMKAIRREIEELTRPSHAPQRDGHGFHDVMASVRAEFLGAR